MATALAFVVATPAAAEPMPSEVNDIIAEFTVLEDAMRLGDWELVDTEIDRIRELMGRLEPKLERVATERSERNTIRAFEQQFDALAKAAAERDAEEGEEHYVEYQETLASVIELYDYERHPILEYMQEEFLERVDAVEAGEVNYEELALEVEEMGEIIEAMESALVRRGVDKALLIEFEAALKKLEKSAEARSEADTLAALRRVLELSRKVSAV